MRRLFSSGIAVLTACLIGWPAYAGSGYSAFPEATIGRNKPAPKDEPRDAETFFKDAFIENRQASDSRETPGERVRQFDLGSPDDRRDDRRVDSSESPNVSRQKGDKKRLERFLRSFIPWGKKKQRVVTVPKQAQIGPERMPETTAAGAVPAYTDAGASSPDEIGVRTSEYVLGLGDVLEISVWKDEALSKVLPILPDGMINFPLIGRIKAEGKTIGELEKELNEKISRYVPDPYVDIIVTQVNSMLVFMIGRVNQPGRYPLQGNMTVLQALAMAGGLNTFAKKNKIKIIREKENETRIFQFDYGEVIEGVNLEQNIRLQRGDIIVTP